MAHAAFHLRTLRPISSRAADRLDRPSLHHSYQVALAKPHMPSDLHEGYAAAFNQAANHAWIHCQDVGCLLDRQESVNAIKNCGGRHFNPPR